MISERSTPALTDMTFPSRTQYSLLKSKISSAGFDSLSDREKTLNRNYNYAWQATIAGRLWSTENDPRYDAAMVASAEAMLRRWYHLGSPNV